MPFFSVQKRLGISLDCHLMSPLRAKLLRNRENMHVELVVAGLKRVQCKDEDFEDFVCGGAQNDEEYEWHQVAVR